jgi:hypothetical protein
MLKIPAEYDKGTSPIKLTNISRQIFSASLLYVSSSIYNISVVVGSGMIITHMESTVGQKMATVHGTLCTILLRNSSQ